MIFVVHFVRQQIRSMEEASRFLSRREPSNVEKSTFLRSLFTDNFWFDLAYQATILRKSLQLFIETQRNLQHWYYSNGLTRAAVIAPLSTLLFNFMRLFLFKFWYVSKFRASLLDAMELAVSAHRLVRSQCQTHMRQFPLHGVVFPSSQLYSLPYIYLLKIQQGIRISRQPRLHDITSMWGYILLSGLHGADIN